jgi:hypothetical protein
MAAAETLTITRGIDDNVKDVDERVQSVNMKVEGIDDKVMSVDSRLQGVDHKVGSVIQGELYFSFTVPQNRSSAFYSVRCHGDRSSGSAGVQSSQ